MKKSTTTKTAIAQALVWMARFAVFVVAIMCGATAPVGAAEPAADDRQCPGNSRDALKPAVFRSSNFVVHTDLPAAEAEALIDRLETTVRTISAYWRRPLRGKIQCYVVADIGRWPDSALPHPQARVLLTQIGGATINRRVSSLRNPAYEATVFALATPGIAEHETVHAYCCQTFGALGPDWYKEGMAELGYFGRHGDASLRCPPALIDQLRCSPFRTPREITRSQLTDSVVQALTDTAAGDAGGHESVALWTPAHAETVRSVKQSYRWSWALCYLLANNPNYATRFRALGRGYVTGHTADFHDAFGAMDQELDFEFRFMLDRMTPGFSAELCRWDWSKPFQSPIGQERFSVRTVAARGYQASGLRVTRGDTYSYRATGSWSTEENGAATDADGLPSGKGRLIGVIEHDHRLTVPITLGCQGEFTAGADGKLHVRCFDDWGDLADNRGALRVVFQLAAE